MIPLPGTGRTRPRAMRPQPSGQYVLRKTGESGEDLR